MSLKSQLSHLMPVAEACNILGEDRVSGLVYGLLKLQQQQVQTQQALSTATTEQLDRLEENIRDQTAALVQSMLYTTNTAANRRPQPAGDAQAKLLQEAMQSNNKKQSSSSLMSIDGSTSTPTAVEQHIPPPIRVCWKRLSSRPLMLDKMTMIKYLVPMGAQPHPGPGGHMGLFDCLTYALQTKPSSAAPTTSVGGLSPPPLIGIPDICIFFAICHKYWALHTGLEDENDKDPVDEIVSFDVQHPAVTTMAQWMFLVYDAYQKKGTVPRDTVNRFLSDVYGEESYKVPPMSDVLRQVFPNPNSPLTSREFVAAIVDTMSYSPLPSHFMLDWMATLSEAMMPPIHPLAGSGDGDSLHSGTMLPESTMVFLQTMEQQRRWLPQICDQYHLADHRLYEIKRRFHSLVESSPTVIQGDPMGDESGCATAVEGAATNGNTHNSSNGNTGTTNTTTVGALPKHVIPAAVFYQKACYPSDELGHGGYLPLSLAERVFESVSKLSSPTTDIDGDDTDMDGKEEEKKVEDCSHDDRRRSISTSNSSRRANNGLCYWDLAHVLQFGGMCVRSEDNDKAMVTWIMQLFGKRGETTLNRTQLGNLLLCLCDHKDFRDKSDRPKWADDDMEDLTEVDEVGEDDEGKANIDVVTVNALTALALRLLPESFAQTASNGTSGQTPQIPVSTLVDHMLKVAKSKDGTLSRAQLLKWHKNTKLCHQQRLGPFIMELRLVASVLFGVPPKLASMEQSLLAEIQERHKKRYPQTDVSRRGPRGTVWYIIDYQWYRVWTEAIDRVSRTKDDGDDLRDKASGTASPRRLSKISNKGLLKENGSLALRSDIRWQKDYDIIPPLAWSALQAWYDGGPPIHRTVVPYSASPSGSSSSPHGRGRGTIRTENEIELFPFYVTIFLSDATSRGEARPFQQAIPVSRVNPIRVLLVQLCKGLDVDPDTGRLWVMETTDPELSGQKDWLLNLDLNIVEQRKNRVVSDHGLSANLLLELKDEETGLWPRGIDGKNWTFKKGDSNALEIGDGIVGLYNMGNTCYLNSSIQCLSHTPIFRDYFTSKCYLNDINTTNPLGYEGHLAQVSAVLINSLWKRFNQQALHQPKRVTAPGSYAPVNAPALTPKTFKDSLGKFNEHFSGNEQHDAQELLAFLLGGLSEDLNRIQEKPYIQAPDSDGRPDSELADIWWSNHLKREMSIIVAMFTGQYKSLLKCKTCKYESARFEPFSFLQVPLPEDDTIPVSLIFYPCMPGVDIMKYSVRVHNNGTLYDVLISLAKVLHADEEQGMKHQDTSDSSQQESGLPEPDNEADKARLSSIYSKIAQDMAIVDMRDSFIFKIAPNSWRLPDLQNKDTGELPVLHVYKLDPLPESKKGSSEETANQSVDEDDGDSPTDRCAFLALAQRKSDLVAKDLIHPLIHRVFGTPLLLRVQGLNALSGSQVYDIVAKHLQSVVPSAALKFLTNDCPPTHNAIKDEEEDEKKTKEEIRQTLQKTMSNMEEVSAGHIPRYGFRLRLSSRDGRRCGICPWYDCCIGCLVPDDGKPTVVSNGDSIVIDWHFAVDVATSGFGTRNNQADGLSGPGDVARGRVPGVQVKNHSSCGGAKKKGHAGAITLEDCLDAFAKEEKIPEAYCSKCKDFRVQTKRMSLWRLPPVVIIHLKRFQFTKHMRRKLRDFVYFPIEGLDLSRIMAKDDRLEKQAGEGNSKEESPKSLRNGGDIPETSGEGSEDMETPVEGSEDMETPEEGSEEMETSEEGSEDMAIDSSTPSEETGKAIARDEQDALQSCSSHLTQDNGRSEMLYDLYGVVHHQGALSGGHYVASLKSEIDGQWRLFNDAQVYEIHSRDVVDSSAYILFYIRRDVASQKLSDFWDTRKRDGEGLTEEEMDKLIKGRSDRCVIS